MIYMIFAQNEYVLAVVSGDENAAARTAQREADRLGAPVYYHQYPDGAYILVTPRATRDGLARRALGGAR